MLQFEVEVAALFAEGWGLAIVCAPLLFFSVCVDGTSSLSLSSQFANCERVAFTLCEK